MSLTQEQVQARLGHLFSTDVAAALGADPAKTPIQLYLEKRGETERKDMPEHESAARFGHHFEMAIGQLYSQETGIHLTREQRTLYHPEHKWMGSHFDFRASGGTRRLVEIKFFHPSRRKQFGEPGSADIPTKPLLQCLHELAVADAEVIDLAVLFGNTEFCIFTLERDFDAEMVLIEREREFMHCIESANMPDPISDEDLRLLYPKSSGLMMAADDDLMRLVQHYAAANAARKVIEKQEAEIQLEIQKRIGDAGTLTYRGQTVLTYKSDNDGKPRRRLATGATDRLRNEYPAVWEALSQEVSPARRFLCKIGGE